MRLSQYPGKHSENFEPSARVAAARVTQAVLIALAAAAPGALLAQTAPANDSFTLGTVEVIGQREAAATAQTTDVATAEQIAARHRDDLAEVLDLIPGVSVQNLGQRRERLVSVRGFSSRQVPLFIDGIPVYVPYDGNVDLSRFGVDYVSQVVVSKGLSSLLYGPNILGGAINVISRRPTQPFEARARIATETDDHFNGIEQRAVFSVGGMGERWYGHLSASYTDSDGYRLPHDFQPVAAEDGGARENADSRDVVISAKIGYAPDENNEYALSYYRQDGEKHDPPYAGSYLRSPTRPDGVQARFWNWPYWDKESVYFVARNAVTSQGTLRWRLFRDSFRNALESFDDATYTTQTRPYAFHGSNYDDYTYGGSIDFEWSWNAAHVTRVAAHYRQDVHREAQTQPFLPQQRSEIPTYDVAIEHEWRISDALALTPSYSHMIQPERTVQVYDSGPGTFSPIRTDESTADNVQLIANYRLSDTRSLVAGVSRKTRFPTIKERFSGGLGAVVPNPGLDPETALHYELGYEVKTPSWNAKVALFQSKLTDAIQSITLAPTTCASPPCTQLQNIGEQRNRGVELSLGFTPIEALQLSGQINVVDVDNLTNPNIRSTNTPEYKYLLASDWQFLPQWALRIDAQHESKRYSNSSGSRVAGAFTLANAFLRFTPTQGLGLELGVRNATDELYAYEEGFYEAGRTWLAQLDYRF
ncbi:MAG TPA: TonB-dependent receptor [Povalibacter sp.]|nr:TonB-dependent receptor [Povalibacter sp.]